MIAMTIFMGSIPPLEPVPGVAGLGYPSLPHDIHPRRQRHQRQSSRVPDSLSRSRVATFTCFFWNELAASGRKMTRSGPKGAPTRARPLSARLVDSPSGEDHAGHHRLAGWLLDDQPNARLRTRKDHLDAVPSLHFRHALADQDGREAWVADVLLGVGVIDVLAVEAHPHPDQPLGLAADLRGRHDEEGARFIDSDDALFLLDVLRRVSRVHRDDLGLGVTRQLLLRARRLKV